MCSECWNKCNWNCKFCKLIVWVYCNTSDLLKHCLCRLLQHFGWRLWWHRYCAVHALMFEALLSSLTNLMKPKMFGGINVVGKSALLTFRMLSFLSLPKQRHLSCFENGAFCTLFFRLLQYSNTLKLHTAADRERNTSVTDNINDVARPVSSMNRLWNRHTCKLVT